MAVTIINKANIPAIPINNDVSINLAVSYNPIKGRLAITFYNTSLVEAIEILKRSQLQLANYQIHPYLDDPKSVLIVDDTPEKNLTNTEVHNG